MVKVKHAKPESFYKVYERKLTTKKVTHYCPGCGHGVAHKLIAEIIDELGIQDRVIFLSPVGCSVFAYYYFDVGNVQCSHGMAPAVGTGIARTLENSIVISYQGDGDLAGIGMSAIIHAANRGENMAVFFINNAIYGMTGGQMAPTTLLGQKTLTTPMGRSTNRDGNPIGMCELINSLTAPVFIERVSLANPARVIKARRAFKKALFNQVERKGFSFVEVLSPCPVNWKMSPLESRKWIINKLEPVFPVQNFRDIEEKPERYERVEMSDEELLNLFKIEKEMEIKPKTKKISDQHIKIAGFGGQGVMSAGVLLANCAIMEGLNSTWLPSYGPEMRGGTANASVIISENIIGSPVVDNPNVLIAMNAPSLDTFEDQVSPGGFIIVNSSLINRKVKREDVEVLYVPASEIAKDLGLITTANIVVLGVYIVKSRVLDTETLKQVIPISIKKKHLTEVNLKALQAGIDIFKEEAGAHI